MGFTIQIRRYPPDVARGDDDPRHMFEISGDPVGLRALRDLVDRALAEGEAFVSDRMPNTINTGAVVAVVREDGWEQSGRHDGKLQLSRSL